MLGLSLNCIVPYKHGDCHYALSLFLKKRSWEAILEIKVELNLGFKMKEEYISKRLV